MPPNRVKCAQPRRRTRRGDNSKPNIFTKQKEKNRNKSHYVDETARKKLVFQRFVSTRAFVFTVRHRRSRRSNTTRENPSYRALRVLLVLFDVVDLFRLCPPLPSAHVSEYISTPAFRLITRCGDTKTDLLFPLPRPTQHRHKTPHFPSSASSSELVFSPSPLSFFVPRAENFGRY